jgi:hypothetical protein
VVLSGWSSIGAASQRSRITSITENREIKKPVHPVGASAEINPRSSIRSPRRRPQAGFAATPRPPSFLSVVAPHRDANDVIAQVLNYSTRRLQTDPADGAQGWQGWAALAFSIGLVVAIQWLPAQAGLYIEALLLLSFWCTSDTHRRSAGQFASASLRCRVHGPKPLKNCPQPRTTA